jgi:hypothetical protein
VAGIVMMVVNFLVFGFLLRARMDQELYTAAPSLQGKGMGPGPITAHVIGDLAIGILLVWLYAAIRPRFGPGMGTAAKAALAIWVCGLVFFQDWLHLGLMTAGSYVMASVTTLIALLIAAWVGGKLYTESATPAMA